MNQPIVILDIDQDFFFSPIISGTISEIEEGSPLLSTQKQTTGLAEVTRVFRPFISKETPLMRATHHNEVGQVLQQSGLSNILLYHLDAHTDLDDECDETSQMTMSNWISVTAKIYSEVYWVLGTTDYEGTRKVTQKTPNVQTFGLCNVPTPPKAIDLIFWTESPGWCRQDVDLFSIFQQLISV